MSVKCVSICMCGFPVRFTVERESEQEREVGWGGGACVLALCVRVCVRACERRAGVEACMPLCEACLLRYQGCHFSV